MQRIRTIGALTLIAVAIAMAGCGGDEETSTGTVPTANGEEKSFPNTQEEKPYRGGEASIEDFGEEASGEERTAVLTAYRSYFDALASADYPAACSYLAAVVHEGLQGFVGNGKDVECATLLPKALGPAARGLAREQGAGRVTKVRVEDDRGFVIFHSPGAKLYQLTMERENGSWKTNTIAAAVLVPSEVTLGRG